MFVNYFFPFKLKNAPSYSYHLSKTHFIVKLIKKKTMKLVITNAHDSAPGRRPGMQPAAAARSACCIASVAGAQAAPPRPPPPNGAAAGRGLCQNGRALSPSSASPAAEPETPRLSPLRARAAAASVQHFPAAAPTMTCFPHFTPSPRNFSKLLIYALH